MLLIATFIFAYYTVWTFVTPFLADDSIVQYFFLPRYYAIALPVLALIVGVCLIITFIGLVVIKSAQKQKAKSKSN